MLFIVKKRDESGNVTHVLCTVRSISDSKRREEDFNFAAEATKREAEMKRRDARRVPIIAMSANAFAEDIINSRLVGMNVHLAKPLDAEKMIIALKQCMADNSDVKLHEDL